MILLRVIQKACCVLTLCAAAAPCTLSAADSPKITYVGGQLTIQASGSTLGQVLAKVAVLTGVSIDIPDGAGAQVMPVVNLGPGPARQILSTLLTDSNCDFMIQASDNDSERLQSVLIMPRVKSVPEVEARAVRSPYSRFGAPTPAAKVEDTPEQVVPAPPPSAPDNATPAEAAAVNPPPADQNNDASRAVADQSTAVATVAETAASPDDPLKPAHLSPPVSLVPQVMNQQLQQMYQQRMQMVQQARQAAATAPAAAPQ